MSDTSLHETVFCRDCGSEIRAAAEICPECGVRQRPPEQPEGGGKDPGIAAIASFLVPGLGQIYNGQIAKGIISGIIVIGLAITIIGLVLAVPIWIILIYDAYSTASADPDTDSNDGTISDAVTRALTWYRATGPEPDLTEQALKRYQGGQRLSQLPDSHRELAIRAFESYSNAHEDTPAVDEVLTKLREYQESQRDDSDPPP